MTVSIKTTSKKYHGAMAAGYEAKRKKQIRWDEENRIVETMLAANKPANVLDCPVGTGRFLKLYEKMDLKFVDGIDSSTSMLALAAKKKAKIAKLQLLVGDASDLDYHDRTWDTVLSIRFLDLIDEPAMQKVTKELCRVAKRQIIVTIRLGDKYVPKSNTATHDKKKFYRLVDRCGWKVAETQPIFKAGWHVIRLVRR